MENTLDQLADEQLLDNFRSRGCVPSLEALSGRHVKLWSKTAFSYSRLAYHNYDIALSEELSSSYVEIFMKAVTTFDTSYGTRFITHFGNTIRYYCLNKTNLDSDMGKDIAFEAPVLTNLIHNEYKLNHDYPEADINEEIDILLDIINKIPDERMKKIVVMKDMVEGALSFKQIGAQLGLSHEWVRKIHEQAHNYIKGEFLKRKVTI